MVDSSPPEDKGLIILPEPEILSINPKTFGHRSCLPIWEACLRNPGKRIAVKMATPSESQFQQIRKAFWNAKSEDKQNRTRWRSKCKRDGERIYFWILPSDITRRI